MGLHMYLEKFHCWQCNCLDGIHYPEWCLVCVSQLGLVGRLSFYHLLDFYSLLSWYRFYLLFGQLLLVSDEGASPTPVSPVNDESDSDRTLNELLSSGDSVSLRKNESVNVSSLHWGNWNIKLWIFSKRLYSSFVIPSHLACTQV